MNIKSLKIFSQNVRKNKILTDTILKTQKSTTNIIFIQEPPRSLIKYTPSSSSPKGEALINASSHPNWTCFSHEPTNQEDILRVTTYINRKLDILRITTYINRKLDKLRFTLRSDLINHRDINLISYNIQDKEAFVLKIYSNISQTAIKYLCDNPLNINNVLIITGDFNIRDSD